MVDGYVGTLRYLIEPGMTIVEIWVNEAASEELLETSLPASPMPTPS